MRIRLHMNPDNILDEKTSTDGIEYPYLDLSDIKSAKVEYELAHHAGNAEMFDEGYSVHHLYISCEEISEKGLPLEANPREPSQTKQVDAMQETLEHSPKDFVKKNNGMVLFATGVSLSNEGNKATLDFTDYEGICNGGHTYFAITTFDDEIDNDATVHVETITLPEDLEGDERRETIIDIAGARNNNNQLEKRSEADFLGYYNEFKQALTDSKIVQWHEGDSTAYHDAFASVQFIRLLKALDVFAYYHPINNKDGSSHKSLATSKNRPHSQWSEGMENAIKNNESKPLHYLLPLIEDIFRLRDQISYDLQWKSFPQGFRNSDFYKDYLAGEEHTSRSDDNEHCDADELKTGERRLRFISEEKKVGLDIKQTLEVLFLGLFRTNIYLSPNKKGNVEYVGWYIDPIQLWDDRKSNIADRMVNYFNDVGRDPKKFIRTTAPFSEDLFELGYQREPPNPDIIYKRDIQKHIQRKEYTVAKFKQCSPEESTHILEEKNGDGNKILKEKGTSESISSGKSYKLLKDWKINPN